MIFVDFFDVKEYPTLLRLIHAHVDILRRMAFSGGEFYSLVWQLAFFICDHGIVLPMKSDHEGDVYFWLLEFLLDRLEGDPRRAGFFLEHLCRLPPLEVPARVIAKGLRRLLRKAASVEEEEWRLGLIKQALDIVTDATSPETAQEFDVSLLQEVVNACLQFDGERMSCLAPALAKLAKQNVPGLRIDASLRHAQEPSSLQKRICELVKSERWSDVEVEYRNHCRSKNLDDLCEITPALLEAIAVSAGEDANKLDELFFT